MAKSKRFSLAAVALVVAVLTVWQCYAWWTYPPAVEFHNLDCVQLLGTAISSRNPEWIDRVEQAIDQRHSTGEMSDAERQHFQQLVDLTRSGEWERAERECFAFAEAQLNRRRKSPPSADTHEHNHEHVSESGDREQ